MADNVTGKMLKPRDSSVDSFVTCAARQGNYKFISCCNIHEPTKRGIMHMLEIEWKIVHVFNLF